MYEIEYVAGPFAADRAYYETLLSRQELLAGMASPKVAVRSTLITTFGLARNEYSGAFANMATLDDLFGGKDIGGEDAQPGCG